MEPKIAIFIPCFNTEASIQKLLSSLSSEVLDEVSEILLVDNASTDRTVEIIKSFAKTTKPQGPKISLICNSKNYGLGGSQKISYRYFLDNHFSHFMIIHGDNQGDADLVAKRFLSLYHQHPEVDVIIGSRFAPESNLEGYNPLRVLGNKFFNLATRVLTGLRMSDAGSGIIFVRTEVLKSIPYSSLSNGPHFNPQLNILLNKRSTFTIHQVPLDWQDSEGDSSINALGYSFTLLKILVKYRIALSLLKCSEEKMFGTEQTTPEKVDLPWRATI